MQSSASKTSIVPTELPLPEPAPPLPRLLSGSLHRLGAANATAQSAATHVTGHPWKQTLKATHVLKRKTVLVLGAGASVPFGFPTGSALASQLVEELHENHHTWIALTTLTGYTADAVKEFRDTFLYSGKNSVDAFLEHRPEYLEIGKLTIAALLIPYERPNSVFRFSDQNWLRYLYDKLNSSFEEFSENRLAFVTFNYDRCVEFFLYNALRNTYRKSHDEIVTALAAMPVIHLHGRLGYLPWERDVDEARPFDIEISEKSLRDSMVSLKIIHEDISDGRDADFNRAKELLMDADQIRFLGFGYNATNIKRLGVLDFPDNRAFGTRVGLADAEAAGIAKLCQNKITLAPGDCMTFIRERITWD
jgi:hypothetical protein